MSVVALAAVLMASAASPASERDVPHRLSVRPAVSRAALAAGDVVVLDDGGAASGLPARLIQVNVSTGAQTLIAELSRATGFALAPNGDLLVADYQTDEILRIDAATQGHTVVASGGLLRNVTRRRSATTAISSRWTRGTLSRRPGTTRFSASIPGRASKGGSRRAARWACFGRSLQGPAGACSSSTSAPASRSRATSGSSA
jgi:hypothetical protein